MGEKNTLTLKIERMAYGSDAIAHTDEGKTVFVSGAVMGDTAEVTIVDEAPNFAHAKAVTIIEPSHLRVESPCPYASVCGGCPWSSLSRDAQLSAKRDNIIDSLTRIGHLDTGRAEALVADVESPSDGWGYRNKVELATELRGGRITIGMHTQAAKGQDATAPQVVRVDSCALLDKKHTKLVKSVSGALGYLQGSSADIEIERVGIRASRRTKDVEIALWTKPGPFPRARVAKVLADACKPTSVVRVLTKGTAKARKVTGVEVLSGKGFWRERIAGETMLLSAPSFFQVNTQGAERLVDLVLELADPKETDEAFDLYSGAGTFTLPLARHCDWVSAVEASGPAIRDLRRNLESAGFDNAEPIGGDAGREFPDTEADIIVVDPPRAGLAPDVVDKLSKQPARTIVYVSCDPATLARDIARFEKIGTYRAEAIHPVDLFPQTYHVESVVKLTRAGL